MLDSLRILLCDQKTVFKPHVNQFSQGRIKGGAKGAAAPGPAISRGPHFWEVQKIILKNQKT